MAGDLLSSCAWLGGVGGDTLSLCCLLPLLFLMSFSLVLSSVARLLSGTVLRHGVVLRDDGILWFVGAAMLLFSPLYQWRIFRRPQPDNSNTTV